VFHEEPPEDYDEFFTRYGEALYFLEHQSERIAYELGKLFNGTE